MSLQRSKTDGVWHVSDQWKWYTVTRMPSAAESDARFLINELRRLLVDDIGCLESAYGVIGILTDLKSIYVKEKMS